MTRFSLHNCPLHLLLAVCLCRHGAAWEIELKDEVSTQAAVVRLGDISQITGLAAEDARALEQIVLAPGPSRSYSRSLSFSQIRKILQGRGVELDECQFTGAFRSVVGYSSAATSPTTSTSPVRHTKPASPRKLVRPTSYRSRGGVALVGGLQQEIADMVGQQLIEISGELVPWDVDVTIAGRALSDLPDQLGGLTIEGLGSATEGRHSLVACFTSDRGDVRVPVEALATRMVELVVPIRSVKRGEVIGAGDVEMRYVPTRSDRRPVARRVEEVVGRQIQLALRAGEPMPMASLKKPILVKRREEVEVLARRGGIAIKMRVRSLDEGALGDVIAVEKLDDSKERFVARVTGVQQVERFVSGASTHQIAER